MAKTIKEMAEAHAPIERNEDWNKTQKQILKQTSFECGANAVLEEIEKLVKFNRWAAQDLYELIKQLKK